MELCFDRNDAAVNKLDVATVTELSAAVELLAHEPQLRGVLITSAKDAFIVGADIAELVPLMRREESAIADHLRKTNGIFTRLEDLDVPTVAAINGFALGGGLELALAACWRIMSDTAQIGVPEMKLGLFPGAGGTTRLPRVSDMATAIQWITDADPRNAVEALRCGVVDEVCAAGELRGSALRALQRLGTGPDWRERQQRKREPVLEDPQRVNRLLTQALAQAEGKRAHQPAAFMTIEMMQGAAPLPRAEALELEHAAFARVARTQAAASLVRKFLGDQKIRKLARSHSKGARPVRHAVVLGAGIMGGGIALESARAGIPVRVTDVSAKALDAMVREAGRVLDRQVSSGRLPRHRADAALAALSVQVDNSGFDNADIFVEAVVERLAVKHELLRGIERLARPDAVLATNTSSLRVNDIAAPLMRPENCVGLHFFNPVPLMQLVEVVRGERTGDAAVATAVAYALALGKTPVVVKDCPGFLVNRLLMAYTGAARRLIAEGADFLRIDRAMEAFGWPMGPSRLQDVMGIDTGSHVAGDTAALLSTLHKSGLRDYSDAQITDRLMLAFIVEAARALEEEVVGSAAELDFAVQLALGCPAHVGGPLQYADWLGLPEVVRRCEALQLSGPMYEPTGRMRDMAATGDRFHAI